MRLEACVIATVNTVPFSAHTVSAAICRKRPMSHLLLGAPSCPATGKAPAILDFGHSHLVVLLIALPRDCRTGRCLRFRSPTDLPWGPKSRHRASSPQVSEVAGRESRLLATHSRDDSHCHLNSGDNGSDSVLAEWICTAPNS